MRSILVILGIVSAIIFISDCPDAAKMGYSEGDWVSFLPARMVNSIAMDQNTIYFATSEAGVLRFDRYSESWRDPLTTSDGLPSNNIIRVGFDQGRNELWIDTDRGAGIYEPTFQNFILGGVFPPGLEQIQRSYRPDNLFVEFGYTYFPGYILDPQGRRFNISRALLDDRYRAWLGFRGLGPAVVNTRAGDLRFLRFGPFSADQRALVSDGEYLYSGGYPDPGYGSGIAVLELRDLEWSYYESPYVIGLPDARVNCAEVSNQSVWFGTASGLVRFDISQRSFSTYTIFTGLLSNYVSAVKADGKYLWVGTDNGLNLIRFVQGEKDTVDTQLLPRDQSFLGQFIYDIQTDSDFIYVGNQQGVFFRPKTGENWLSYGGATAAGRRDITAILSTKSGLWFGQPGAIIFFNPKDEVRTEYTPPGLGDRAVVNDLIAYQDKIFAATDDGLVGVKPATGESRIFAEKDGLIDSQVYSLAIYREYLWCATPKGLTRVYIPALKIY